MRGLQIDDYDLAIKVIREQDNKIQGLCVGDILAQNQALILIMHPGELKENPAVGAGIADMLLDNDTLAWSDRIRRQLEFDGQRVDKVSVTPRGITIDASY